MQFLLTNDDGIEAPGLAALHRSVTQFVESHSFPETKIWVVAPDRGRSECGHSVTTTHDLRLTEVRTGWFSLDGTPVDCVRVALACLCPDVDAVFSGINAGANVGIDLLVSGTFAAAREAAILGKPAMAISHYRRPDIAKTWDHTPGWLDDPIDRFLNRDHDKTDQRQEKTVPMPAIWNVNLPAIDPTRIPKTKICLVDQHTLQRTVSLNSAPHISGTLPSSPAAKNESIHRHVRMISDFHGRPRTPGSDVDRCFAGDLTISQISPGIQSS